MLILGRDTGEAIGLTTPAGEHIRIVVCAFKKHNDHISVRLGIDAPRSVVIVREELANRAATLEDIYKEIGR